MAYSTWRAQAAWKLNLPRWRATTWPLTHANLIWATGDVANFIELRAAGAILSPFLLKEIAYHWLRADQLVGGKWRNFDVFSIFAAIEDVEKDIAIKTKPHSLFRDDPGSYLRGLWHKHFSGAQDLVVNLRNELGRNWERLLGEDLDKLKQDAGIPNETSVEKLAPLIARSVVFGGLERRARGDNGSSRLTGEWIIFAKVKGGNIYLALAAHTESKGPELRERLHASILSIEDIAMRSSLLKAHPLIAVHA